MERRTWLAVVSAGTAGALVRGGWRELPLIEGALRPAAGDRIAVVVARGAKSVLTASVLGTADVRQAGDGPNVRIRHRVVSPEGHEPRITEVPRLVARVGWTDDRLRALLGGLDPLPAREFVSAEDAVRERALAYGPGPKRPMHSRPRTPGRRVLATARVRSRGRASR